MGITHAPTHYTEKFSVTFLRINNLRHILHMLVGVFNLFIVVYSMTGYGVIGCVLFIIFDRSSALARS